MLRKQWHTMHAKYSWGVSDYQRHPSVRLALASLTIALFMVISLFIPINFARADDGAIQIDSVRVTKAISNTHAVRMAGTFTTSDRTGSANLDLVTYGPLKTRSELLATLKSPNLNRGQVHPEVTTKIAKQATGSRTPWSISFNGEKVLGSPANGVYVFGILIRGTNLQANHVQPWFYGSNDLVKTKVVFLTQLSIQNTHLANGTTRSINQDARSLVRLNSLLDPAPSNITFLKDPGVDNWLTDLKNSALKPAVDEVAGKLAKITPGAQTQIYNHTNLQALFKNSPGDIGTVLRLSKFSAKRNLYYLPRFGQLNAETLGSLKDFENITPVLSNTFIAGTGITTSAARASVNGLPGIIYDAETSRCFSQLSSDRRLNCILAHTAMITAEAPFQGRTIAILTPPFWHPESGELQRISNSLTNSRWAQIVALSQTSDGLSTDAGYVAGKQNPFSKGLLKSANKLVRGAKVLGAAIENEGFVAGFESARLRSFSETFAKPRHANYFLKVNQSYLNQIRRNIAIQTSTRISFASQSTDIPLTIANKSGYPIQVKAQLTSASSSQFQSVTTDLISVPNNQRVTVSVPVKLQGTGSVPVTVNLLNSVDKKLNISQEIYLTSSSYQSLARTLVWGACGLLLLFAIVNAARKRRGGKSR